MPENATTQSTDYVFRDSKHYTIVEVYLAISTVAFLS